MTTSEGAWAPADAAGPSLGERLSATRARKGVDIRRAARETKIRARHLDALERGDPDDLPGAVYATGFLRTYASYLGLDPDDAVHQWQREHGAGRRPAPLAMPRALEMPGRRLTLSRNVLWAALLTALVAAFVAYLGVQLLRYARPPALTVTAPAVAVLTLDGAATSYLLRGTSIAGAAISIVTPGRDRPYRVYAAADATWSAQVELRRGPNQFDISATDPASGKSVDQPIQVFIRVPLPSFDAPTPSVDQSSGS
jgi:transcriptional regulator with XRE-family HTH domain